MRRYRAALAATVLAGATAVALSLTFGTALPSLADTENPPPGPPVPPGSSSTPSVRDQLLVGNTYFASIPVLGRPITVTVGLSLWKAPALRDSPVVPVPEGLELAVRRTDLESPAGKPLGTVKTNANSAFVLTDTPPAGGEVRYTFTYPGSAQIDAKSFQRTIDLARQNTTVRIDKHNTVHAYGSTVTLTATLGKTHENRVVEFLARPYGQAERLVKRVSVDNAGKARAAVKLARNTWVTARFAGDGRYEPALSRVNLWTKVAVDTKLTRHYKTQKIGSTTYQFFRRSQDPLVTHAMSPYVYREARTNVQAYQGGRWQLWSGRFSDLDARGKAAFTFVTAVKNGTKFRIRAEYANADHDRVNYPTVGAWKYFTFTK